MKTTLLSLALLLFSTASFAQTKLADEYPAMMQARNADAAAFFQPRTTPDLVFIAGHDGSTHDKDWLMGLFKNQKSQKADITDLKTQRSGAPASG